MPSEIRIFPSDVALSTCNSELGECVIQAKEAGPLVEVKLNVFFSLKNKDCGCLTILCYLYAGKILMARIYAKFWQNCDSVLFQIVNCAFVVCYNCILYLYYFYLFVCLSCIVSEATIALLLSIEIMIVICVSLYSPDFVFTIFVMFFYYVCFYCICVFVHCVLRRSLLW